MLTLQVIGNLGADAQLQQANGQEFITFRVAHTEKFTKNGQEVTNTVWVDCSYNGNGGNLLPFLKKGAKVFVQGMPTFRVFPSAKHRCYMPGVNLFVRQIELCGGSTESVPRELATTEGVLCQVNKYYHTPAQECWNSILFDRNMNKYNVNEQGFIFAAQPTESTESTESTNTNATQADAAAADANQVAGAGAKTEGGF